MIFFFFKHSSSQSTSTLFNPRKNRSVNYLPVCAKQKDQNASNKLPFIGNNGEIQSYCYLLKPCQNLSKSLLGNQQQASYFKFLKGYFTQN